MAITLQKPFIACVTGLLVILSTFWILLINHFTCVTNSTSSDATLDLCKDNTEYFYLFLCIYMLFIFFQLHWIFSQYDESDIQDKTMKIALLLMVIEIPLLAAYGNVTMEAQRNKILLQGLCFLLGLVHAVRYIAVPFTNIWLNSRPTVRRKPPLLTK